MTEEIVRLLHRRQSLWQRISLALLIIAAIALLITALIAAWMLGDEYGRRQATSAARARMPSVFLPIADVTR